MEKKLPEALKGAKKSLTEERKKIFLFVQKSSIFRAKDMEQKFPNISRASIFRTLKLFCEIGILRKVQIGTQEGYEVQHHDTHHEHIQCRICGNVSCFHVEEICHTITQSAQKLGFAQVSHSLSLSGICPQCQGHS